ncbi:PREDICTED: methylmalonic aciduria and homocystinuria type D homolog, mitochondrial-like [Amphimedon queenslandica]|uniref:Methylmalonic aciduria and homocystinuria type D protein, mitochondrial n=1 Tax=Amphimedon queenslandica TaxID=400682 RepID=A0A1X7VQU6_AMPQE|nr:PREDICTED: methylmalonic aciduria and homocystinuria type D homolog, mitochondrial-like [Amphimedon queenslandica]|eukprot:XP_003383150.1 PREDICTED: methylmalonic aciduria and homocystinuria type D homolog, mitochondrial-like [Amphimedon queenslandica]
MSKITGASRVVAYLPSLRTFLHRLRATTKTPSRLAPTLLTETPAFVVPTLNTAAQGRMGRIQAHQVSDALEEDEAMARLGLQPGLILPGATGLVIEETEKDEGLAEDEEADSSVRETSTSLVSSENVECCLQECPSFLHDELMLLFPDVSLSVGELRILTLCERTHHDMTGWSHLIEEEREDLLGHFIDSAKEICSRLISEGYWADFIDPSSGRAFYGPYTPHTFYETDERFRYLGFDILDLGCCKCITHPSWGSHTFVGTIFTSAPVNAPPLELILKL